MKSFALIVGLLALAVSWNSWACSIEINQNYLKNTLVTAAANEFNIGLHQATKIQVKNFAYRLEGVVPGSSCEEFFITEADIVISYKKNLTETCELSTRAIRREELNAETFPFEHYEFPTVASSCSFTPIRLEPPRRLPIQRRIPRL